MSSLSQSDKGVLSISRYLEGGHAVARVECPEGQITVLADQDGGSLPLYEKLLTGQKLAERIQAELDGHEYDPKKQIHVGFADDLPEQKIGEFFISLGCPADQVEGLIDTYELRKVNYLTCNQLNSTAARQLLLLRALKSNARTLVLNDPFLPFNGRWREWFAKLLLDDMAAKKRIVVCLNLSFIPQCWSQQEIVVSVDVGKLAQDAVYRYKREVEKKEARAKKEKEKEKPKDELAAPAAGTSQYTDQKIVVPIPENLVFAYKEVSDFIFEPLAKISQAFRSFRGIAAFASLTLVVLMMGFVMFPNMGAYRAKLVEMASKFTYESPPEPIKPEKPEAKTEDQPADEAQPEPEAAQPDQLALSNEEVEETAEIDETEFVEDESLIDPYRSDDDMARDIDDLLYGRLTESWLNKG